jgi:hypothetical protein
MLRVNLKVICKLGGIDSRDYPYCWDKIFFLLVEIFKIETFHLRLCHVTTVKTNQDFQDLLKLFQICQDISTLSRLFEIPVLQVQKSWQIEKSWLRKLINQLISILIETSWSSRSTFLKCRDFLKCQDLLLFARVKIETLDQDTMETNRVPQA